MSCRLSRAAASSGWEAVTSERISRNVAGELFLNAREIGVGDGDQVKLSGGWLLLVSLAACSSSEGENKQVGGGQSGTDSQGAYTCVLDDPIVESVPLDRAPLGSMCSPNEAFAKIEGSQVFRCEEVQGTEGELHFELYQQDLFVIFPDRESEICSPTIQAQMN